MVFATILFAAAWRAGREGNRMPHLRIVLQQVAHQGGLAGARGCRNNEQGSRNHACMRLRRVNFGQWPHTVVYAGDASIPIPLAATPSPNTNVRGRLVRDAAAPAGRCGSGSRRRFRQCRLCSRHLRQPRHAGNQDATCPRRQHWQPRLLQTLRRWGTADPFQLGNRRVASADSCHATGKAGLGNPESPASFSASASRPTCRRLTPRSHRA
jgi:hypothetical protein